MTQQYYIFFDFSYYLLHGDIQPYHQNKQRSSMVKVSLFSALTYCASQQKVIENLSRRTIFKQQNRAETLSCELKQ